MALLLKLYVGVTTGLALKLGRGYFHSSLVSACLMCSSVNLS